MKRIIRVLLIVCLFFIFSSSINAKEFTINKMSINSYIEQTDYYFDKYKITAKYQVEISANNDLKEICFDVGDFNKEVTYSNYEYSTYSTIPEYYNNGYFNNNSLCFKNINEGINTIEFASTITKKCSYGICELKYNTYDKQINYYLIIESNHKISSNMSLDKECNTSISKETDKYLVINSLCSLNNIKITDHERIVKHFTSQNNNESKKTSYNRYYVIIYCIIQLATLFIFEIYIFLLHPLVLKKIKSSTLLEYFIPFVSWILSCVYCIVYFPVDIEHGSLFLPFLYLASFFAFHYIAKKNLKTRDLLLLILFMISSLIYVFSTFDDDLFLIIVKSLNPIFQIVMGITFRVNYPPEEIGDNNEENV